MSKVEKFIQDCTRNCSNETTPYGSYDHTYHEWLTPDQARRAVEIAREEVKQQMMEEGIDGEVAMRMGLQEIRSNPRDWWTIAEKLRVGDKVKIVIIKEE